MKEEKFKELAKPFLEHYKENPEVPIEFIRAGYLHIVECSLSKEFAKALLPLLSPPKENVVSDTDYTWNTQKS